MGSILNEADRTAISKRVRSLSESSAAKWGSMDVVSMLKHLHLSARMGLGELEVLLERIGTGPSEGTGPAHPLFGPLTRREWGVVTYKHTDHHLRQFGA